MTAFIRPFTFSGDQVKVQAFTTASCTKWLGTRHFNVTMTIAFSSSFSPPLLLSALARDGCIQGRALCSGNH
jgi:hypothetical protein